jgi:phytoene synthase
VSADLDRSYRHCREVARRRAKNFYYSFLLLRRDQRNAMCAIYAFMRYCDDLSDEPGATREPLDRWRVALDHALEGKYDGHPTLPAFHDAVRRYKIPHQYFYEMIDGVSSDLEPRRIQTFDELYRYCYQVASVVGMTTIHIFGFDSPDALALAEKCGVAFQLTNILRDVREDSEQGRIYLPAADLARFDVKELKRSPEFIELMRFEAARARSYYAESQPLLKMVDARSRSSLWALIEIYSRLLGKIEDADFDVLSRRIALSKAEKLWIVIRATLG